MKRTALAPVSILALLVLVAGCAKNEAPSAAPPATSPTTAAPAAAAEGLPATLFATSPLPDAKDILAVRSAAKAGDTVTVRGRIGKTLPPFVKGRAIMTIVDTSFIACSDKEGDGCETPWDYCCIEDSVIAPGLASVRVSDANGQILHAGLAGANGLKELSTVVVRGKVRPEVDGGGLEIDAESIYIEKL